MNFKNEDWRVYLKSLDAKSIDLVLTDPPYGMAFQSGARKEKYDKIQDDDNIDWLDDWVANIKRVVKDDAHLYIWCSWHKIGEFKFAFEDAGFKVKNILVWAKNGGGMGDLKGGYGGCYELCLFINMGKDLLGKRDIDVIRGAYRTGNEYHPTQKPVNLMEYLIEKSSKKGDAVLDCFTGSGTTGIAAVKLGREFYGCELKKSYYDIAYKRIKEETTQGSLF